MVCLVGSKWLGCPTSDDKMGDMVGTYSRSKFG